MGRKVLDEGEFGFIRHLRERFANGAGVEVGLGDDAAVLAIGASRIVFTTDMMVDGVHFDPAFVTAADLGFKAIASNVSDVAAMGGTPLFAAISVAIPPETRIDPFGVVDGVQEACAEYAVSVVGGDTTRGTAFTISVSMIGDAGKSGPVLRSTARAGDLLCVTGTAGDAAAGLSLMKGAPDEKERKARAHKYAALVGAYAKGQARVREGTAAAHSGATAMIDVSDGIGADANHLARESELGLEVRIENLPLSEQFLEATAALHFDAYRVAISGGEDYELLIATHPHDVDMLRDAIAPTPLTVIGEFSKGATRIARWPDGTTSPLEELGWDHFK